MSRADLEQLYAHMERRSYNVVYRQLWSSADAQDVVQEAFVRLWKKRSEVRMETVESLLFRIAINLAKNKRRSRRLWRFIPLMPLASTAEGADESLADHREAKRMQRALDALPEDLRNVFVMCELFELSYRDVAEALGIKEGTVGSRRNTALARMREVLDVQ